VIENAIATVEKMREETEEITEIEEETEPVINNFKKILN
jgi:hypothetical protein